MSRESYICRNNHSNKLLQSVNPITTSLNIKCFFLFQKLIDLDFDSETKKDDKGIGYGRNTILWWTFILEQEIQRWRFSLWLVPEIPSFSTSYSSLSFSFFFQTHPYCRLWQFQYVPFFFIFFDLLNFFLFLICLI